MPYRSYYFYYIYCCYSYEFTVERTFTSSYLPWFWQSSARLLSCFATSGWSLPKTLNQWRNIYKLSPFCTSSHSLSFSLTFKFMMQTQRFVKRKCLNYWRLNRSCITSITSFMHNYGVRHAVCHCVSKNLINEYIYIIKWYAFANFINLSWHYSYLLLLWDLIWFLKLNLQLSSNRNIKPRTNLFSNKECSFAKWFCVFVFASFAIEHSKIV